MMTTQEPLELPALAGTSPPTPFPIVATFAPVVVSVTLWLVTGSLFALVFAALGPFVAIASLVDGRRGRRNRRIRAESEFASSLEALHAAVADRHDDERASAWRSTPSARTILSAGQSDPGRWRARSPQPIVLGCGAVPSALTIEGRATDDRAIALRAKAAILEQAPVCAGLEGGVGVVGSERLARAYLRALVVQCCHAIAPGDVTIRLPETPHWDWARTVPHADGAAHTTVIDVVDAYRADLRAAQPTHGMKTAEVVRPRPTTPVGSSYIVVAGAIEQLPPACSTVIAIESPLEARIVRGADSTPGARFTPTLVGEVEAARWARDLRRYADLAGFHAVHQTLPASVRLADLRRRDAPRAHRLDACFAVDATGPVMVDLVEDGPHALVVGTTGSGKSELLVSWVAAIAQGRSPAAVSFLLIDFKGGAAFAPLAHLKHVVGVVTDLGEREAARAVESIGAELRYRERVLAEGGYANIDDSEGRLGRLVIVVDEFAALLERFPALDSLFTAVSARGRSLGIHLVLSSQRVAGVVRDGILANCALRIALRVLDTGESTAVIGSANAARLDSAPPGRFVLRRLGGPLDLLQTARSEPSDLAAISRASDSEPSPRRPWRDPLPSRIERTDLENLLPGLVVDAGCVLLGVADDPEAQRYRPVVWNPILDGHLAVVGRPQAGSSDVLDALEEGLEDVKVVRPGRFDERELAVWDSLEHAEQESSAERTAGSALRLVLILDDLDTAFVGWDADHEFAALDRLGRLLRDGGRRGLRVVVSVRRFDGRLRGIGEEFRSTLFLAHSSPIELAHAGGRPDLWSEHAPIGSGQWRGLAMQTVSPDRAAHERTARTLLCPPVPDPSPARPVVVVTSRPRRAAEHWSLQHPNAAVHRIPSTARPLAAGGESVPLIQGQPNEVVLVGDVEAWTANWSLLATLRENAALVFEDCSVGDVRTITRSRNLPPLLGDPSRFAWCSEPGEPIRRGTRSDA